MVDIISSRLKGERTKANYQRARWVAWQKKKGLRSEEGRDHKKENLFPHKSIWDRGLGCIGGGGDARRKKVEISPQPSDQQLSVGRKKRRL